VFAVQKGTAVTGEEIPTPPSSSPSRAETTFSYFFFSFLFALSLSWRIIVVFSTVTNTHSTNPPLCCPFAESECCDLATEHHAKAFTYIGHIFFPRLNKCILYSSVTGEPQQRTSDSPSPVLLSFLFCLSFSRSERMQTSDCNTCGVVCPFEFKR